MKFLNYFVLILILIACSKEEVLPSEDILGEWSIHSVKEISSDSLELYPENLPYNILAIFDSEMVSIIGCNLELGEANYSARTDGRIEVDGIIYIEPCANKWVDIVAQGLSSAEKYSIESDSLNINSTNSSGDIILTFKSAE